MFVPHTNNPEKAMATHTPVLLRGKSHGQRSLVVHGVAKSQTRLSNFPFTFHFHALEKEMATQSSVLAWRIPGMGEPGGLPSMGSHRVGHDGHNLAAANNINNLIILIDLIIFNNLIIFNKTFSPAHDRHFS